MANGYFKNLYAFNWRTGQSFPLWQFNGYTKSEAKKLYKERFGLKYKRDLIFIWE